MYWTLELQVMWSTHACTEMFMYGFFLFTSPLNLLSNFCKAAFKRKFCFLYLHQRYWRVTTVCLDCCVLNEMSHCLVLWYFFFSVVILNVLLMTKVCVFTDRGNVTCWRKVIISMLFKSQHNRMYLVMIYLTLTWTAFYI